MKKFLSVFPLFTTYYLLFTISPASAQEPVPIPRCVCSPGDIDYDCYKTIPDGWCKEDPTAPGNAGRGQEKICNGDCLGWTYTGNNVCTTECEPPKPQITPIHESFENSIGAVNEGLEGGVLSGTRDVGIDPSQRDNYRAASALVPAGGPNHELRVKFIKSVRERQGDYKVYLADGTPKSVWEIWNECTENGDLDNWQAYQEKLENCPNWGFVPTTHRRLASEPTPAVKTQDRYFKDRESPFVLGWGGLGIPLEWIVRFFQNIFCISLGLFCPADPSLPLKNPFDAPDWTKDKLNVPAEAESNARLLGQFLLPKDLPLGELPKGENTYFETTSRDPNLAALLKKTLAETGQAARLLSADGGLLPIFQPKGVKPEPPSSCDKDDEERFNPEKCASEYYFRLQNASPGACGPEKICYSDTPDQKTFNYPTRLVDDRSYTIQAAWDFLQQGLWPQGLTGRR